MGGNVRKQDFTTTTPAATGHLFVTNLSLGLRRKVEIHKMLRVAWNKFQRFFNLLWIFSDFIGTVEDSSQLKVEVRTQIYKSLSPFSELGFEGMRAALN